MFVRFFIQRPVFASVCALLIVLAGAAVIPTLPIAQFPNLAPPQVGVTSVYIGASAQTVETAATMATTASYSTARWKRASSSRSRSLRVIAAARSSSARASACRCSAA